MLSNIFDLSFDRYEKIFGRDFDTKVSNLDLGNINDLIKDNIQTTVIQSKIKFVDVSKTPVHIKFDDETDVFLSLYQYRQLKHLLVPQQAIQICFLGQNQKFKTEPLVVLWMKFNSETDPTTIEK